VPYEVVREVTKEVPIEVTRELADVPYWQRNDFERQLQERKERRRGDQYAHDPRPYRLADRSTDFRGGDPSRRQPPPIGRGGVAPGYKVYDGAGRHDNRGRYPGPGGYQTSQGMLTGMR